MKFTVITALTTIALGGSVQAQDLTISQWTGPKHPVATGYAPLIANLTENGFNVQQFEGGALLGAKLALAGIGDGLADMGLLALTFFPACLFNTFPSPRSRRKFRFPSFFCIKTSLYI